MRIHRVHVNDQPTSLFPNIPKTQCIIVDNITLPLKLRGPLSFLQVCRPTSSEVQDSTLQILQLTLPHDWDPYCTDTISTQYMLHFTLGCNISTFLIKHHCILSRLQSTSKKMLTPSLLATCWGIGIETAQLMLNSTYQE